MIASSGISIRLWRLYAQAWLVCLLFPIIYLFQAPLSQAQRFFAWGGLLVFALAYTCFMWSHPLDRETYPGSRRRTSLISLALLSALVFVLVGLYGGAFLWLLVGISAIAGIVLPASVAFAAVMVLTLTTLGLGVVASGDVWQVDWLHLIPLVLLVRGLGLDMAGAARLALALRDLHAARSELARRAVVEERLRLARDLHDLLGHSLSLITLKSELAGRLIEKEPSRAAREIHEVEAVAREALREVREAVAGYRQPTLLAELDGARGLLAAAGIACAIEQSSDTLPPTADTTLAWVIREGVTNVIRHSRARQCRIRISQTAGKVSVEILNDGYWETQPVDGPAPKGSGLAGLAERIANAGGRLEAGPMLSEGPRRFRLAAELPAGKTERDTQS